MRKQAGAASPTSKSRLAAADRQVQALELRKTGMSFREIAQKLGYSDQASAYNAVMAALDASRREPADEVRQMELERLDEILKVIWPHVVLGRVAYIDRAIHIMERRARYLGLDAPVRMDIREYAVQVGIAAGLDETEAIEAAEQIVRRHGTKA